MKATAHKQMHSTALLGMAQHCRKVSREVSFRKDLFRDRPRI